jgi:hypothetical protein
MKRKGQKQRPVMVIGVHAAAFRWLERERQAQSKELGARISHARVIDRIIDGVKARAKK